MKIFLTGSPGIGKTTIIKKLANSSKDEYIGFWTEEFRDENTGKRLGFKIVTTDGKQSTLAIKNLNSQYKVGSYAVNLKDFEKIVIPRLQSAIEQKNKIIIIDEIGKMELFSNKFIALVNKICFSNEHNIIATIPIKDVHPLIASIRKLTDNKLIKVTKENRDKIPEYIQDLLKNKPFV